MTKNQKTLIGVGVLAVAGYLVYQNYQKTKTQTFVNMGGRRNMSGKKSFDPITVVSACKACPTGGLTSSYNGRKIYQCCGTGVWGYSCLKQGCASGAGAIKLVADTTSIQF